MVLEEGLFNLVYKGCKNVINAGLDAVFPPCCPFCGEPRGTKNGKRMMMCEDCAGRIVYVREPRCLKCGKTLDEEDKEFCRDCTKNRHLFEQACAVYEYSDMVKNSIYRFKYYNKREYALSYAKDMAYRCGNLIRVWNPDVIVPVPLHFTKLKKRGFNQAELMAYRLGRELGIRVDNSILYRIRNTSPMKELDNTGRINNLKNAFQVSLNDVKYNKILLVDDIYTTGATFDACTCALKEAGIKEVYGISLCIGRGF
ncbi:MAG: double zinc ribbon domain-containing protein [Lachnospira sp.]